MAKQLITSGWQFVEVVKKVERFWKARPRSVCMKCCGIDHKRLVNYANKLKKCIMCAWEYLISKHQCGVKGCNKGIEKLYVHIVA